MPDIYFNKNKNQNSGNNREQAPRRRTSRPPQQPPQQQRSQQRRTQQQYQQPRYQQPSYQQQSKYYNAPSYKVQPNCPVEPVSVREPKQRHPFRVILIIILVLIILYLIVAHALFGGIDYNSKVHKDNQYVSELALKRSGSVKNIMLLGVDARPGETISRADTMMMVSIDKSHKEIKLTSFLRDSYVEIPGHGMNKLNAACSEGGVQLVLDTIEYNYNVNINNYAAVNFTAFQKLIDALGGVDVAVTPREASYLNRTWYKWSLTGKRIQFSSGQNVHMDGEHALMFCRIRKLDSDVQRTRRQRLVISAVKDKLSNASFGDILGAVRSCLPYVQTDLSSESLLWLAIRSISYKNYEIMQKTIPAVGTYQDEYTNAGDSLVFDINENASILQDFIYRDGTERSDSIF